MDRPAPAASQHTPLRYTLWLALIASAAWLWLGGLSGMPRTVLIYLYWAYAALIWFTVFSGYRLARGTLPRPETPDAARQALRGARTSRLIRYALQALFIVLLFVLGQLLLAGLYLAAVLAMVALRASSKARRSVGQPAAPG